MMGRRYGGKSNRGGYSALGHSDAKPAVRRKCIRSDALMAPYFEASKSTEVVLELVVI